MSTSCTGRPDIHRRYYRGLGLTTEFALTLPVGVYALHTAHCSAGLLTIIYRTHDFQANWGQSLMYHHEFEASPYYRNAASFEEIAQAMGNR